MINLKVTQKDKDFAKKQLEDFSKIKQGKWRYENVETWRGIVCEMVTSNWLEQHFKVDKPAKGLDNSGVFDDCDMIINSKKVEIKSATKNCFKYIMPKVWNVTNYPKDTYVGVKYNETIEPNEVQIIGYIKHLDILKYPIKKNKGGAYYEIPLKILKLIKWD